MAYNQTQEFTSRYYAHLTTITTTVDLYSHASGPKDGSVAAGCPCRAIIVTGAGSGTLKVLRPDSASVTITGLTAGMELPIQARKLLPTSDLASLLVLW